MGKKRKAVEEVENLGEEEGVPAETNSSNREPTDDGGVKVRLGLCPGRARFNSALNIVVPADNALASTLYAWVNMCKHQRVSNLL